MNEAINSPNTTVYKLVVEAGKLAARIRELLDLSRSRGILIETLPREVFRQKYQGVSHQRVVAYLAARKPLDLPQLVDAALASSTQATLVLLDEIQDPHNLGAIIRSAWVMGVQGIIIPKRRSVPLNETVAKCSAGALESMPIASVANLVQAVEVLKQAGFWIVGLDMDGGTPCHQFQFEGPVALVIGGESKGIRPLLKKSCDFTIAIPMQGALGSLNASAAAAIIFYEISRQKKELD